MASYCNIIYKMLVDGISFEYIFAYIKKIGYTGNDMSLRNYISIMSSNNGIEILLPLINMNMRKMKLL